MRYLRHFCRNLKSENCHPDVIDLMIPKEIKDWENIPMDSTGEESERLDKICSECDQHFFKIEKKECPACFEINIIPDKPFSEVKGSCLTEYFYKCTNSSTRLYSTKNILK